MLPLFELTCHWYVFPLPVAENVKEVLAPNEIVLLIGWLVTTGELFVFNITILEFTVEQALLTTQRYFLLLRLAATELIVRLLVVTLE